MIDSVRGREALDEMWSRKRLQDFHVVRAGQGRGLK